MLEDVKTLLGDTASNYTEPQISLALKMSLAEIEDYCGREVDEALEMVAVRLAVIKLNRLNTEGLASQGYSGVSESYVDGYPADILAILNRKRKIKVL
jgi:hypothetical protein